MDVIDGGGEDELEKERRKKEPAPDPMDVASSMLKMGAVAMAESQKVAELQVQAWLQIATAMTTIADAIDRAVPRPRPARRRRR